MVTTKKMTIDAFEQLPDDGYRYELVDGKLERMPPTGEGHGDVNRQFIWLLESYIRPRGIEKLFVETSFVLSSERPTVREPDIAFVHAERLLQDRDRISERPTIGSRRQGKRVSWLWRPTRMDCRSAVADHHDIPGRWHRRGARSGRDDRRRRRVARIPDRASGYLSVAGLPETSCQACPHLSRGSTVSG